jgi:hypothetical protein
VPNLPITFSLHYILLHCSTPNHYNKTRIENKKLKHHDKAKNNHPPWLQKKILVSMPGTRRICKNTSQALQWWWRQILHVSTIFSPSTLPHAHTKNQLLRSLTAKKIPAKQKLKFSALQGSSTANLANRINQCLGIEPHTHIQETATRL